MPPRHTSRGELVDLLLAIGPLVSRWLERLLAASEQRLTLAQYLALRAIGDEALGGSELARRAGISGPAVSQLLAGLLEAGLIERRPSDDDRRRQTLLLSPAGMRARRASDRLIHERFSALLAELPGPETEALSRILPRVQAALSGEPPPRLPSPPRPPHGPRAPRPGARPAGR